MQSKPRYPKAIGTLLGSQSLPGSTIRSLTAEGKRLNQLLELVRSLLPEPLDSHCLAVVNGKNSLILYTESSAWASRLRFFSRQLKSRMEDSGVSVGKVSVKVLITRGPGKTIPRKPRHLTADNAKLINEVAENLGDLELSAALKRLSRHVTVKS